jgi:hypothetical protein
LIAHLAELSSFQDEMLAAIEQKQAAMRRADVDGMLAASRLEAIVASKVTALDANRRAIVGELAAALDMDRGGDGRQVTLRVLMAALSAEQCTALRAGAEALRVKMLKVAEANRVVELVSREILEHFRTLFAAMMRDDTERQTYSERGRMPPRGPRMLDARG